jgi:mRNA-degrading endonuclease HigB of HigAB toxin-antitoxin module/predicted DNA-binding protein
MVNELNHHNPEYVTWKYEELSFALLGGIRIEGLHSMRVTLKIDFKTFPSIRHSLDLYNETQTEKFIKNIAERFTLSTTYVHKAIGNLINTVEDYRLQQIDSNKLKTVSNKPTLSKEEITEAETFLKGLPPFGRAGVGLLQQTNDCISQSGVIGEEVNRLIMYLVFTSRKTNRPLHIISFGSSGVGKSHLQEKVAELIPKEDKIELTSVSGNAFYYYVDDDLGHKLILIEDYDGVFAALYPIRELQSKQKISKTITVRDRNGNTRTLHLTVKGPVSIGGCTTSEHIYEDNANRSFLIYLDESEAQDERVMEYQRKLSAGKIDTTDCQRILQPISVRNPYAEQLIIPKEVFKPRRTNAHYIAFIEAITFYKQYQREHKVDKTTGEIYIETTLEDIQEANELMKEILLKKSDELGYATRKYFEQLKEYLQTNNQKTFVNSSIRKVLREHPSKQKRFMIELQQYGLVKKVDGDKKKGFVYEVISHEEYEKLQQSINTAMDEVLSSLQVVQRISKPLKAVNGRKKAEVVQ